MTTGMWFAALGRRGEIDAILSEHPRNLRQGKLRIRKRILHGL
jgi:hypothetical protein